ncbi:MAG: hypothetical protein QME12_04505 [Nanoarchaeota archaeon]|nr:hypothetical protein [Nanoarchaeota archaeon]
MIKLIIKKLSLANKKYATRAEIESFCRELKIGYPMAIGYLARHKYLIRILRGIFYVMSIEERKMGKLNISYLEAIKEALRIKGIKSWYFGLETALKLNNLTHEYFAVDTVISGAIFRAKPINIMGHKIAFIKLKPSLAVFGIKKDAIPYSDAEKTMLDFIYLKRRGRIGAVPLELISACSKAKLIKYSNYYGNAVKKEMEMLYGKKRVH